MTECAIMNNIGNVLSQFTCSVGFLIVGNCIPIIYRLGHAAIVHPLSSCMAKPEGLSAYSEFGGSLTDLQLIVILAAPSATIMGLKVITP